MKLKRLLLIYLSAYLSGGGFAFAFFPKLALDLFQSNQDYGDIMPRLAGIFMIALGGFVGMTVYYQDYKYYPYSIVARTIIVIFIFWLYFSTTNPLFLIFNIIVLTGLIPSYFVFINERMKRK